MRCDHCPAAAAAGTCLGEGRPTVCARAARPGEDHFRRGLARIAGASAAGPGAFPPLRTQAAGLAGAAVRFVASGGETVAAEELARRLEICGACEFYRAGRCTRCACYMPLKARAAALHCPLPEPKW